MLAKYAKDPTLFEHCITLIDSIFPGIKAIALDGIKYHASWPEISLPFIIKEQNEIMAHLGIIPLDFTIDGIKQNVAAIHGICVKPEYRRKGLFRQLMQEALQHIHENFDSALLFTDQVDLYTSFGFRVLPESDFVVSTSKEQTEIASLKQLAFEAPEDLNLIHNFLTTHSPLSNLLDVRQKVLFILNMMDKPLYYSKELDLIIAYTIKNNTLYIQDILSSSPVALEEIIAKIPEGFNKIILQFFPDNLDIQSYSAIPADPECSIMVSNKFNFKGKSFRFPEPYRC